jgi:hypothetical protein
MWLNSCDQEKQCQRPGLGWALRANPKVRKTLVIRNVALHLLNLGVLFPLSIYCQLPEAFSLFWAVLTNNG